MCFPLGLIFRLVIGLVVLVIAAKPQDHAIRKRGTLNIPQTHCWSFSNGKVSREEPLGTCDVWYEAVNSSLRYLVPLRGVTWAIAGGKSLGYMGCLRSKLSGQKINFRDLPRGTMICALAEGLYSEFSIEDLLAGEYGTITLRISYTTWEP